MSDCIIKDLGMTGVHKDGRKYRVYLVRCSECRKERTVNANLFKKLKTTKCASCASPMRTHGKSKKNKIYNRWVAMRERCRDGYKLKAYSDVTICKEWDDFENFERWALSSGFKEELELDKDILCEKLNIYPKIYSPETCMWITKRENIKSSNNFQKRKFFNDETAGIRTIKLKNGDSVYVLIKNGKTIERFKSMDDAIAFKKDFILKNII